MADTPLKSVSGWSPEHVARMAKAWITTAEQVVALSATPHGTGSLAEQLQVSEAEAQRLVDLARGKLASSIRARLEKPADTSHYGLGALRPPPES